MKSSRGGSLTLPPPPRFTWATHLLSQAQDGQVRHPSLESPGPGQQQEASIQSGAGSALPRAEVGVENAAKTRARHRSVRPRTLWAKTNSVCTAVLCFGLRQLFLRPLPRALQVPGTLRGGSAPCPDHTNLPRGHPGPCHVAGPSLRLGPSKAPSPCSFSFLEHSRGLASLPTFLGLQASFPDPC